MKQKAFPLINKGMNRDLSISKVGESNVYENRNIRITVSDNNTLLSVTNERGNKQIDLNGQIAGELIGWNVVNNHIVLFTHDNLNTTDRIYRIDYLYNTFVIVRGDYPNADSSKFEQFTPLYQGNLGFDLNHPIESVVYSESDRVNKVYWVDGKNKLRFINITASLSEIYSWVGDTTSFDTSRAVDFGISVNISRNNNGNTRANGVAQYIITYFNKHGQETGYVWLSDIVYLSPDGTGGAADETNTCSVTLNISNVDSRFDHIRVYSIFKSTRDGNTTSYIVGDYDISNITDSVVVIDDGAHLTTEDTTRLLYLGSVPVIANTIAHKDQTLFIGGIESTGKKDVTAIQDAVDAVAFGQTYRPDQNLWESALIEFCYSDDSIDNIHDVEYSLNSGMYPYKNQLELTSSQIMTFKAGEKYRFALKFQDENGVESDAFWIGDKINTLYPYIDHTTGKIKRVVAKCKVHNTIRNAAESIEMKTVRLMIAEATDADRSVKAQGIVNPTVFNTWERNRGRLYSMPSWITRPRHAGIAFRHFDPIVKSDSTKGEIQCNYWEGDEDKKPVYRYNVGALNTAPSYYESFDGVAKFEYYNIAYSVAYERNGTDFSYTTYLHIISARDVTSLGSLPTSGFSVKTMLDWTLGEDGVWKEDTSTTANYKLAFASYSRTSTATLNHGKARSKAYERLQDYMVSTLGIPDDFIIRSAEFHDLCQHAFHHGVCSVNGCATSDYKYRGVRYVPYETVDAAFNITLDVPSSKWKTTGENVGSGSTGNTLPAYYMKHLMFIDENVITLDSPEISYGATVNISEDSKFRIVGIAKTSSIYGDYTLKATHGIATGDNVNIYQMSSKIPNGTMLDGIISWPLWRDRSLEVKESSKTKDKDERSASDYEVGSGIAHYMVYLWNHSGCLSGFDSENGGTAMLEEKTFANMKVCYDTIYCQSPIEYTPNGSYICRKLDPKFITLRTDTNLDRYYSGMIEHNLSVPGSLKYPLYFSNERPSEQNDSTLRFSDNDYYFRTNEPVGISYVTDSHAVVALDDEINSSTKKYLQTTLPVFGESEVPSLPTSDTNISGPIIPWLNYDQSGLDIPNIIYWTLSDNRSPIALDFVELEYSEQTHTISFRCYANEAQSDPRIAFYSNISAALNNFDHNGPVYTRIVTDNILENKRYYNLVRIDNIVLTEYDNDHAYISVTNAEVLARDLVSGDAPESIDAHVYAIEEADMASATMYYVGLCTYNAKSGAISGTRDFLTYGLHTNNVRQFVPNNVNAGSLTDGEQYLLIGEIYREFGVAQYDTRYGGISLSAVRNNRFIPAGPAYVLSTVNEDQYIYGNQGDTYFQRWDSLRVRQGANADNAVLDGVSVMLESHINLDGRTTRNQSLTRLASIEPSSFDVINPVYSQTDNFIVRRDNDEDSNPDRYASAITWTLQKNDLSMIDEWTHITLANSVIMDADKGQCRALRRMQNSIIAFQDRAIAEVLFNSRTQLTTQDGVPIEIGNSGKVDGIRYITNKFGCMNKWSIVEGKSALYFVDSINKTFCGFDGSSIDNISTKLGFDLWFRSNNSTLPWTPGSQSINAYYDRINSDVYLVKRDSDAYPSLVYNETLGVFTSFYDYGSVPMMTNIEDRFISFKNHYMWLEHEGLFCNFYGVQKPFWIQYRVTPDPYGDKVWTNIEYRADFRRILDVYNGQVVMGEAYEPSVEFETQYQYMENETFDFFRFWNEYQTTATEDMNPAFNPIKRFRIWNMAIPRAKNTSSSVGLDRIRNPWVNILLKKNYTDSEEAQDIMELHDVTIKYFE